jgi:hypothetical protein
VVLNTHTLDPTIIVETVRTTRHLMGAVAGDTPYEIISCIPHLEAIFFEASIDLHRIFPDDSVFVLQFAKTQPKNQLDLLFEKGGGPRNLRGFLDELTAADIVTLRASYPLHQLMEFLTKNLKLAIPRP